MKVIELTEIVLGKAATDYLSWYLDRKGDTLSKLVLAQGLQRGLVFAYLPPDVDAERLAHLHEGGIMGDPDAVDAAKEWLARFVSGFLHASPNRIATFETFFDAGSIAGLKVRLPFFIYRPTDYGTWDGNAASEHQLGSCLYLTSDNLAKFNVDDLVCGPGRPDTGFLCCLPSMIPLENGAEVSRATLEALASRVSHVIVPAYDSETYLIWSRPSD
jgi:hypothetical protein